MDYGYGMGYGGMGGGMGGGQQNQSMMMSSALMASVCLSALAGVAFWLMNEKSTDSSANNTTTNTYVPPANNTPTSSSLDGAFAILQGSLGLWADGDCKMSSNIMFKTPTDSKTVWNIRKAGTDAATGEDYYTLQSSFRSFNKICAKQYLTAPLGCKSPPFLSEPVYGPSQMWFIRGNDTSGYVMENLACKQSRFEQSYLQASAQDPKAKPSFAGRTGTAFNISKHIAT